jgi:multidrug resistance efflux pump
LANKAVETFDNLVDLAMNVDSRYAGEIFSVASSMYGHALTAKQAKINKKLKTVELQLKKARLDLEQSKLSAQSEETVETAEGQVLTRNDLLARVLNPESGNATSV